MDFFGSLLGSSFAALVLWMVILPRTKKGCSVVSIFHKRYPAQKLKQSVWPNCLGLLASHVHALGKALPWYVSSMLTNVDTAVLTYNTKQS